MDHLKPTQDRLLCVPLWRLLFLSSSPVDPLAGLSPPHRRWPRWPAVRGREVWIFSVVRFSSFLSSSNKFDLGFRCSFLPLLILTMVVRAEVVEGLLVPRSVDRLQFRSYEVPIWVQIEADVISHCAAVDSNNRSALVVKTPRSSDLYCRDPHPTASTTSSPPPLLSSASASSLQSEARATTSCGLVRWMHTWSRTWTACRSTWIDSAHSAALVGSRGVIWAMRRLWLIWAMRRLWLICACWAVRIMVGTVASSGFFNVAIGAILPVSFSVGGDGAILGMIIISILAMELLFLSAALQMLCSLKMSMVLQVVLHMRKGIPAPNPHCFAPLQVARRGLCWTYCDGYGLLVILDGVWRFPHCSFDQTSETTSSQKIISTCYIMASSIANQEWYYCCCFSCTCLSLSDGCFVEDAVSMLFGLCHRRWTTTPSLLIPRFNRGDTLSLSSVKVIQYLQLNSSPRVHIPDRLSGEPPAGHQLDCTSIEALEDCRCGNFEYVLSTDERKLYGSICDLQHLLHEFSSSSCCVVQLGTCLSCCTIKSHVAMYHDP